MNKVPNRFLIVISGPSGAGKSTLVQALLHSTNYLLSVSCTTRKKRPTEQHGREYYFISKEEFEQKIAQNQFLEYAQYDGNYYGTLREEVDRITQKTHCLLDIEVQGAQIIREKLDLKECTTFIFIEPPDEKTLRERLLQRGNNPDFHLERRIQQAKRELAEKHKFDRVFTNHDSAQMIQEVRDYLQKRFSTS
ncbi:MAG: guanylate kinase [Planctomycetota bacterium]